MHERTLAAERIFNGRVFSLDRLEVELEPGVRSIREIVRHGGAIAALARLPDGRFVFVRQYRKAIEKELLEAVAGGLEKGEKPEDCAVREIREETGYGVLSLTKLGAVYSTPGFTDEILHLFLADLTATPLGQQTEHDERIVVEILTRPKFEACVTRGDIQDAKTLAAWLLFTTRSERDAG